MQEEVKYSELVSKVELLQAELAEAHDIIEAIRAGEVDAFIVRNDDRHELYTLKTADHTYREFIEKMAEGAVTVNKEGVILYCNSSFAKMLNLPLEKVLGYSFIDFIPAAHRDDIEKLIYTGWETKVKAEISLPGHGGTEIPVLLSVNIMEIDGGIALSIIVTNLSFQKQVQQQLKQKNQQLEQAQLATRHLNEQLEETVRERTTELFKSREHFKFLADHIPAIVWTADSNGVLDYYNNRWFEYTGSNKLLSQSFSSFVHPDDVDAYLVLWKNRISSGAAFEMVHRLRKGHSNNYKWHHSQAIPFRDDHHRIVAWFGISTDIDEQKLALEKKDEFISIASHELKTPVTSIKGYVQLLQFNFKNEGNNAAAELLNKVDAQINKLTNLITDLLDVKKIENGQLRYQNELFDFNVLVKEVMEETTRVLNNHPLTAELTGSTMVLGDRNKIGQVIINFIENAGKYSPAGTPIILRTLSSGNKIRLTVQDFGIGIPKDQLSKIFDRFFRVHEDKENTYSGLGLGLYISAEIVKRHKGAIGVESEKGKGSTFYFELPVSEKFDT